MSETKASARQKHAFSPAQAFELAVTRHRAGRLDEAEQLYRAVLNSKPDHFGALHYLGLVCTQQRKLDEALALLQHAVALNPQSAEARTNLGIVFAVMQRAEEAIAQYEKAIALQPDRTEARNNLGIVLQRLKRQEEAVAQFEAALALKPGDAFVRNNLGLSLAALGRHDEAVALYKEAVALKPDYADAHGNLGAALNKLGRHREAIPQFERALDLNPDLAETQNGIGDALVALGRHEDAVEHYRRALEIRPRFAEAHHNLGNTLVVLGRRGQAIAHFKTALDIDPSAFETYLSLAGALAFADDYEGAIAHCRTALSIRPDRAEAHWLLGCALEAAGRSEQAVASHLQALAIEPEFARAHNGLGCSLISLGRLDEGRRAVERAIELAPTTVVFHRNLAMSKRFDADDPQLRAMEELARDTGRFDENQRRDLHFSLGKAYVDLNRQDVALPHLVEANAIKRRQITYDESTALAQFDRIKKVMTRELIERKSGNGAASELPIFIVGMPRSGSTLIEQIVASHPDVFGAGELLNFSQIAASLREPNSAPGLLTDLVPDMPVERLGELGARYLDSVRVLAPHARRITDKMPANFRIAGLIHLALPGARIIHARRDPFDTCMSCFERHFAKQNQPFTYDLPELGRYYRAHDTLMAHWRDVLPAGVILDVQYEDLVADFEPQARRIIGFCGLDWDERCLAFHRTERSVHTASVAQVREPIYGSSVGRWHSVRHLLAPLLKELGAEP